MREIMGVRMEKQKNIDVLIAKIISLSLRVNRETKSTVFLEFSGHVNAFGIQIYYRGWKPRSNPDFRECLYIDDDNLTPDCFDRCRQIISKLCGLLPEK